MEGHGVSLPDELIQYGRELFERFDAEIEQDPRKRDVIFWVLDLLRVKKVHALEVLDARAQHVGAGKGAAVTRNAVPEISQEVIDLTHLDDEPVKEGLTPTTSPMNHPLPPRPPTPSAPLHQSTVKKRRPGVNVATKALSKSEKQAQPPAESLQASSSATKSEDSVPLSALKKEEDEPCVGDWYCKHCERWNKLYHKNCRTYNEDRGEGCDGMRSFSDDVACIQEDDGQHKHNKMGRYKGDWYCGQCEMWNFENRHKCRACTTLSSEAEYVMDDDDSLRDVPPLPPVSESKTEAQKKKTFFNVNGRHITPRKKRW